MTQIIATLFRSSPRPETRHQVPERAARCTREDLIMLFAEDLSA